MHGDHGDLDYYVEAYESARQGGTAADVTAYVPPREHPEYAGIVVELLRVDVECSWRSGQPSRLAEYCRRFPDVLGSPGQLAPVAFEEYRVRHLHGDSV